MRFLRNLFASKIGVALFFDRFQVYQRLESNSILSQLFLEYFLDKAIIEDGGGKVCKYEYCNITNRSLLHCIGESQNVDSKSFSTQNAQEQEGGIDLPEFCTRTSAKSH